MFAIFYLCKYTFKNYSLYNFNQQKLWDQIYGQKLFNKVKTPKIWWKQHELQRDCVDKKLAKYKTLFCFLSIKR